MKARVKYNNEIIDVVQVGTKTHLFDLNNVEFLDNTPDYWTRLEHNYAGMAMQGLLTNSNLTKLLRDENVTVRDKTHLLSEWAKMYAHALVEKMKKMEERK